MSSVWVFVGEGANFPSGVFDSREAAGNWIVANELSGSLTEYPLNTSVYDWAIANDLWQPKRDDQKSAKFIQRFSSAHLAHFHYEHGKCA